MDRRSDHSALVRIASLCVFLVPAVLATSWLRGSDRTYGKNEYVTINAGRSPDGKYAIAAHGDGEGGYDHFHLYLMDGPTGKRIGPLEEIKDVFETGADVFDAKWSADSHEVSISYRVERHVIVDIRYRIGKGRAFLLGGPEARHPAPDAVSH